MKHAWPVERAIMRKGDSWLLFTGVNLGAILAYFVGSPHEPVLSMCAALVGVSMFTRARGKQMENDR